MNPVEKMGIRIGQLRRERGLTQEKLAGQLGISPQAVSKWENGLGCPDISLLPEIARVLDTSLNELFGMEATDSPVTPAPAQEAVIPVEEMKHPFPGSKDGLTLVGVWGNVACYASTAAEKVEGPQVLFHDGSAADLANAVVTNNGGQEIRLLYRDDGDVYADVCGDIPGDEPCWSAEGIHSLEVNLGCHADCTIEKGIDGRCTVEAGGSPEFMKNLDVRFKQGTLIVTARNTRDERHLFGRFGRREDNSITIYAGFEQGKSCALSISGSGSIDCWPDFMTSKVSIAGSGDMELQGAGELRAGISGSGDITFHSARDVELSIAGSGDVSGQLVAGGVKCGIAGSGDINIGEAVVDLLEVDIAGSGDVSFERMEANTTIVHIMGSGDVSLGHGVGGDLELGINGSGEFCGEHCTFGDASIRLDGGSEATIGRITGRSEERVAKTAHLHVLHRGKQA